jgi:hypothetical protein
MLFDGQITQSVQIATVPREMGMSITEPTHQRSSSAMEDPNFRIVFELLNIRHEADFGDSSAFDEHVPAKRFSSGGVEDADIQEKYHRLWMRAFNFVCLWSLSFAKFQGCNGADVAW